MGPPSMRLDRPRPLEGLLRIDAKKIAGLLVGDMQVTQFAEAAPARTAGCPGSRETAALRLVLQGLWAALWAIDSSSSQHTLLRSAVVL